LKLKKESAMVLLSAREGKRVVKPKHLLCLRRRNNTRCPACDLNCDLQFQFYDTSKFCNILKTLLKSAVFERILHFLDKKIQLFATGNGKKVIV